MTIEQAEDEKTCTTSVLPHTYERLERRSGPSDAGTTAHQAADFFRRVGYWRGSATVPAHLVMTMRERLDVMARPDTEGVRVDDVGRVTHVDGVVDRYACFRDLATHPAVLEPVRWLVGPTSSWSAIGTTTPRATTPASGNVCTGTCCSGADRS